MNAGVLKFCHASQRFDGMVESERWIDGHLLRRQFIQRSAIHLKNEATVGYFDGIGTAIDQIIDQRIKKLSPMDVDSYFGARAPEKDDPKREKISTHMTRIDGNISALLTHISAMIASLGIILIVVSLSS